MIDTVAIKEIVDNFALWKGDSYRLAILCAQKTAETLTEQLAQKLEAAGLQEAADVPRQ